MAVTVQNILERVEAAGLSEQWVRKNIFPHWWDGDCDHAANHTRSMMAIIEVELCRVLGVDIDDLRDQDAELTFKLDYASRALVDALSPRRRATNLGLLVESDGTTRAVAK